MKKEIKGSYHGMIYIAIYQRMESSFIWSASLEDDEGEIAFIAGHFSCDDGDIACERQLRQKIGEKIEANRSVCDARTLN